MHIRENYEISLSLASSLTDIFALGFLPIIMSAKSPANTRTAPNHWRGTKWLPNRITEHSTVKNFRVVVTTEHESGPNEDTFKG